MSEPPSTELEDLSELSVEDLVEELVQCSDRVAEAFPLARPGDDPESSSTDNSAYSEKHTAVEEGAGPELAVGFSEAREAASEESGKSSAREPDSGRIRQATVVMDSFSPERLRKLPEDLLTIYTTGEALLSLFESLPAEGELDGLSAVVDNVQISGQELRDRVMSGDISGDRQVEIDAGELRDLLAEPNEAGGSEVSDTRRSAGEGAGYDAVEAVGEPGAREKASEQEAGSADGFAEAGGSPEPETASLSLEEDIHRAFLAASRARSRKERTGAPDAEDPGRRAEFDREGAALGEVIALTNESGSRANGGDRLHGPKQVAERTASENDDQSEIVDIDEILMDLEAAIGDADGSSDNTGDADTGRKSTPGGDL